jgi:hypothetical protein
LHEDFCFFKTTEIAKTYDSLIFIFFQKTGTKWFFINSNNIGFFTRVTI